MHAAEWGGMHYVITGKGPDNKITYEGGWQNNRPMGMHDSSASWRTSSRNSMRPASGSSTRKTSTLYFYPPPGVDLATATIEAVRLRHLVEFRGTEQAPVRFVSFKGLTFRHAARTFMENKEPLVRSDWTTYRGGAHLLHGHGGLLARGLLHRPGRRQRRVREQLQPPRHGARLPHRQGRRQRRGLRRRPRRGARAARLERPFPDRSPTLDRTPGPKTANYPADCLVDDCLIYLSGRVEKQTAPVQIELSQGITVRHCSLYDVPRAGINIGDGCWGGHVIEFCDIFDTVKETGDHGSFNSWGRDRFWGLDGLDLNDDQVWEADKSVAAAGRGQDRSSCATTAGVATTAGTLTSTTARRTTKSATTSA